MANKRVLVVDDDVKTVELVKLYLNRDGYRVLTAYDGVEALRLARESHPDLIVLDIMLPRLDGLEVCRDKLAGLDLGADDYVTKPFSPRELAARVRAVLRRLPEEASQRGSDEIKHGELTVNFRQREAFLGSKPLNLTPVEFKILGVLIREPGRVFSRAQLIEKTLGYDFEGFDRTIDVHILNLRRKLEPDSHHPHYVKTVYGAGYKFLEVKSDT